MRARYYHLLSNRKTIKEITFEQWSEIIRKENSRTTNVRTICRVSPNSISFRQGRRSMWLAIAQVDAILEKEFKRWKQKERANQTMRKE